MHLLTFKEVRVKKVTYSGNSRVALKQGVGKEFQIQTLEVTLSLLLVAYFVMPLIMHY